MTIDITHHSHNVRGRTMHIARSGPAGARAQAPVLVLLHGWPEFWRVWQPVMTRLADRYTLIAPDLIGFGESDKPPTEAYGPADHSADLVALIDTLSLERIGVVGHDVGGSIMQSLAREIPERLNGLFFFDFTYPGIGARMGRPERLNEIWYQSFHQMPMASTLVGASRETCRAYIGYFLSHWAHDARAFDEVLEDWVDNFLKPGNLEGGFAHYKAAHDSRIDMMAGRTPPLPSIDVPTCVRWAEHDPIFPYEWTDRLHETFTDLDLDLFPGVGHFPHFEAPELAATQIDQFFRGRPAASG